jgi:hypothetical protein
MTDWSQIGRSALVSGSVAGVVTMLALAAMAEAEGKSPVQPINATSHWLHGPQAGRIRKIDNAHTLVGALTNHAGAIFWAVLFEFLRFGRRDNAASIVKDAAAVSAIAGIVDYGFVPKRYRPGWEHALSNRAVAGGFIALAAGLAIGGLLTREDTRW